MSLETYEKLVGKFELYSMLEKGLADIDNGNTEPIEEVFDRIASRLQK